MNNSCKYSINIFGPDDVEAMLKTISTMVGDQEYDSEYHHGPGENRALVS